MSQLNTQHCKQIIVDYCKKCDILLVYHVVMLVGNIEAATILYTAIQSAFNIKHSAITVITKMSTYIMSFIRKYY